MEIFLGRRAVRQVRLSAADAIDDGDTETLREDLVDAFSEEQVQTMERHIDSGDIFEFISEVLDEWGGDDVDELLELLAGQLADVDVDLKIPTIVDGDDDKDDELDEADEQRRDREPPEEL